MIIGYSYGLATCMACEIVLFCDGSQTLPVGAGRGGREKEGSSEYLGLGTKLSVIYVWTPLKGLWSGHYKPLMTEC